MNSFRKGLIEMLRRHSMTILLAITFVFILAFAGQSAQAEWNVSVYGEVGGPSYTSYGDRIASEYRRGYQVDDWVERGASSVTESPLYSDGIRLSSWATQYEDDYDYGIASAIYFFEIPRRARSIRIKVAYEGEADRGYLDDDIVGRVWIRRSQPGDDYEEYYPREGRYEDVDEPLYGDTFVLRARKRFEIIRISADDYNVDDTMELHVVAEGRQSLDVKYIEVETYSYLPSVRVITRYYRDYAWRPWYNYTYWYFYTGPVYHFSDYYYVRYTYPHYHRHYIDIRKRYNSYLRVYYVKRPREHVRWVNVVRAPKGTRRTWDRGRLNRWTSSHEETRRMYSVVKTGKTRSSVDVRKSRTRIRSVLSTHTRSSPAAVRSTSSVQQRTSVRTPTSRSTEVRTRQGERSSATPRSRPEVRTDTDRQRRAVSSPTRVETNTKTRDSNVRSPVRTRSSSSSQTDRTGSVRQAPTRSSNEQQRETRSTIRSKTRVESSKSKEDERKRSSSVIRTPSRSQSTKKSTPQKKVEVKKDDDDDDEDKKKSSSTKTSTKSESSSTKKRKVRSR
jgi:hypothetical protein